MTRVIRRIAFSLAFGIAACCGCMAWAVEGIFLDNDGFGAQGAISGSTAMVGQRFGGPDENGDVQVFSIVDDVWTASVNLADLLPEDSLSTGAFFGGGALGLDGNTAIVAAYRNEVDEVSQAGSVFLFSRSGGTWSFAEQWSQPLEPDQTQPATNSLFGIAGDLDGDRAIVVAGGTNSAYIYDGSGGSWDTPITLADGSLNVPTTAAIDGQVAAVGTFLGTGHVDIWRCDGETWNYETAIDNPEGDNLFATDIDISGNTMVVSARSQTIGEESSAGAVYIYQYDTEGESWTLQQMIENPEPTANDQFGYSVAIYGDKLIVGAPRQNEAAGAAYLFEREDSVWSQVDKLEYGDAGQWFGEAVAIDEWSLLVGGSARTAIPEEEMPPVDGVVQLEGVAGVLIPGDANRDGVVDHFDAEILGDNWGESVSGWGYGDFNDDGVVNAKDASILAANWGSTGSSESGEGCPVPEPCGAIFLTGALFTFGLLRRRNF